MRSPRLAFVCSLAIAAAALPASGCATLFAEHRQIVTINSNPQGAPVVVDGSPVGVTPIAVNVSNHKEHQIVVGGQAGCTLGTSIGAGWVILDLLGGLLPVVVDVATGDWATLDGNQCSVYLGGGPAMPGGAPGAMPSGAYPAPAPAPAPTPTPTGTPVRH